MSELLRKINRIRNCQRSLEINEFKTNIRDRMLSAHHFEALIEALPHDHSDTIDWAEQLLNVYSKPQNFQILPQKVVQLFKIVQKFPNLQTLNLLQLIIKKVDNQSIHEMFQYDVMKLLHNIIVFAGIEKTQSSFEIDEENNRSNNQNSMQNNSYWQSLQDKKTNSIISQAVSNTYSLSNIKKATENIYGNTSNQYFVQLDLVKATISIISQICRKNDRVRNFAIVNHKSFTYCLKAYKNYGQQIKIEFALFLSAATSIRFHQYQEQYIRITKKCINLFYEKSNFFKMQPHQVSCQKYFQEYKIILKSLSNLVKMKNKWIQQLFDSQYMSNQVEDILSICSSILRHCNHIIFDANISNSDVSELTAQVIYFIMSYMDNSLRDQIDFKDIYFQNLIFLRRSIDLSRQKFSLYEKARKNSYFLLSNFYSENKMCQEEICNFIFFDQKNFKQNIVELISCLLLLEDKFTNEHELLYLSNSITNYTSFEIIQPIYESSQILVRIIEKVFDDDKVTRQQPQKQNEDKISLKIFALRTLVDFYERLKDYDKEKKQFFQKQILDIYKGKLEQYSMNFCCDEKMSQQIDLFLYKIESEK